MIPVSADVAAAITAKDRVLRPTLSIDWLADGHGATGSIDDFTGHISGWRKSQSWSTDLPEQVRIVQGSGAAALTADVEFGDVFGRASTVSYLDVSTAVNGTTPDTLFSTAKPTNAVVGGLLLIAVAVRDLTVQIDAVTDMTPISAVTVGSGTTGMRLWVFQHRLRPTADPYDPVSLDIDGSFGFSTDDSIPYSVACLAFNSEVRDVDVWAATAETVSGTSHTAGSVTVPDGTVLAGFWAWNTGTSGTWTPPAGDTERADVRGTHTSTNIALAATTSATLPAGTYTRTATTSAATADVAMALIAVSPFPARDERSHAANWLSPVNRNSPLHPMRKVRRSVHAGVDVYTPSGPVNVRQFTGFLRDIAADPGDRTAQVEALDGRELMRRDLAIPAILGDYSGLNGTWLVSWALAECGIYTSPAPVYSATRNPMIWAPMHGSLRAMLSGSWVGYPSASGYEVGYASDAAGNQSRATFVPGPYLLGAFASLASDLTKTTITATIAKQTTESLLGLANNRKGRVEFYVRGDTVGLTSQREVFEVRFFDDVDINLITHVGVAADRRLTIRIGDSPIVSQTFGPTVPADGEWHFCGISWDFDATTKVIEWRLDTTDTTSNPSFTATFTGENRTVHVISNLPVSELHVTRCGTSEAWINEAAFTAGAELDVSLLELDGAAVRGTVEAWKLCTDLAEAEQGVSGFDEDGIYRYRTRKRLTTGGGATVQVTLADNTSITDLSVNASIDRVRNVISVPYTAPRASYANPVSEWLWTHSGVPIRIPPDDYSTNVHLPFGSLAWLVDSVVALSTTALALPNSYIIVNEREDGTGNDFTTGISAIMSNITVDGCDVLLFNNTGKVAWLIEGAIGGYVFEETAETTATAQDDTSIKRYGRQPLQVSGSPWIQRADVAESLASLIVADTAEPTPVLTRLRIVGDPRLQTFDRIRVVDSSGLALDDEYWVVSIQADWDGPKFVQTLTCRKASTVGVWGETAWGEGVWA